MTDKVRDRPATLADVAKLAGVSRSLASLAIRGEGYVGTEARERIVDAAARLNYRPNLAARSLASARTTYVGTLVGDVTNPLQAEIAKWVTVFAAENGLNALVSLDAETDEKAERSLDALMAHRISGLIMVGAPYEKPAIARVAERVPAVYIGRWLKAVRVDSVTTDHVQGAHLVVRHLVARGCRRIVHVDGGASPGAERMASGYRAAMQAHGLEPRIAPGAYSVDAGAAAGRAILSEGEVPDAIFACSDLTAIGVMNEAARLGISVPDRMLVAGYDNVTLAATETLALTTVHQSARRLADEGVRALLRRLAAPRAAIDKVLVEPHLVARRTTRRDR